MKQLLTNDSKLLFTSDYKQFKLLSDINRSVEETKCDFKKILNSIKLYGIINPIIVDKDFSVIDGQHRLKACEKLNIKVPYIIVPGSTKALIDLNSKRKNWQLHNYAKYYSNNPSYVKLIKWSKDNGLSLNATHSLIKGKEIKSGEFQDGNFIIDPNEEKIFNKNLHRLMELINIDSGRHKPMLSKTRAIGALSMVIQHKNYNHELFKKKLINQPRIISVNTKKDAISTFLEIYNKNLSKDKRINL